MNWVRAVSLLVVFSGVGVGLFFVEWWKVLVDLVLVLGIWMLYSEPREEKTLSLFWTRFWVVACLLFLLASRLLPFLQSEAPLGYDTGIYLKQFEFSRDAMPEYVSQIFLGLPLITNVQYLLKFDTAQIISWVYVFWSFLVGMMVYTLAKNIWGTRRALGVLFLFVVSFTQWQAFTFILYKNIVALSLLLLSFIFVQRRSFLLLPVVFFLALLQPSDFLIWVVSMVLYFFIGVWGKKDRRYLFTLAGLGSLGGLAILVYDQQVWREGIQLLQDFWSHPDAVNPVIRTGLFVPFDEYIMQTLLFWSFAVLAVVKMWQSPRVRVLVAYFVVISVWVLSKFLFYERFVIELDLIVLILAGAMVVPLLDTLWRETLGKLTLVLLGVGLVVNMSLGVAYSKLSISADELARIKGLCDSVPAEAYVMATDSVYGPWVNGFSCHESIVPGMFEVNAWNYEEWGVFWKHQDLMAIRRLMERYDRDVYLYVGEKQVQLSLSPVLFEKVGERVWKWKRGEQESVIRNR